ncbi:Alpha-12-mannosyltransferase MNN21 [Spathaspora sp. JA1]|nr:Alpha-12-mannosyltransferase MNN21 [Spathaspora sp. JA1]
MLNNFLYNIKILKRRRKQQLILVSIICIYLIFILYRQGGQTNDSTSSVIDESGFKSSWWDSIMSTFEKPVRFSDIVAGKSNNQVEADPDKGGTSGVVNKVDKQAAIKELHENKLRMIKAVQDQYNKQYPDEPERLREGYTFFNSIFKVLYKGKPKVEALNKYRSDDRIYHARYDTGENKEDEVIFSEKYLSSFLQLTSEELNDMKQAHQYVVENLPEKAPSHLYKGDGIVYVGGGQFNWLTLLSIKSLRSIGCTLPVEVFIPKVDEFELELCGKILPLMNARCIYMRNHLIDPVDATNGKSYASRFNFKGYQYKAMAILLSSFENVLLLDSDNIPVHIPDSLFTEEPFISKGLIAWPDFWKRATSPSYYKIVGSEISETELLPKYNEGDGFYYPPAAMNDDANLNDIPLHERKGAIPDPSSESGQLMISKRTHFKPLLLALYYNLYGPTHFYPLFSQGSDGEGDKETFLAATVTLGHPYYQVSKFLNALGHFKDGNFKGCGMGQYDPVEDHYSVELRKRLSKVTDKAEIERFKQANHDLLSSGPRMLFVHANFPKLNPWKLKMERKIYDSNGERIRLYGTGMRRITGYDFEWVQWNNMKQLLCGSNFELEAFKNVNKEELCMEIKQQLNYLKDTIKDLES